MFRLTKSLDVLPPACAGTGSLSAGGMVMVALVPINKRRDGSAQYPRKVYGVENMGMNRKVMIPNIMASIASGEGPEGGTRREGWSGEIRRRGASRPSLEGFSISSRSVQRDEGKSKWPLLPGSERAE